MKLAICVPCPDRLPTAFVSNLIQIIFATQKMDFIERIDFLHATGVRTDKNRNVLLEKIIDDDFTHVLWLDADMVYPPDIVKTYYEAKKDLDIVGCLYFKRSYPYSPIGYIKGDNPLKPFKALNPDKIPASTLLEVDGLGFGGMLVNLDVYRAMGDDKWMVYDSGFHLPFDNEHSLTHDLVFCRKAQEYGFNILLHTDVRPKHMASELVDVDDWRRVKDDPQPAEHKVVAIMPTIHPELAQKTSEILKSRAGYPFKLLVVEDQNKSGFVQVCNAMVKEHPAEYYVYLTDDIFPSRNWLSMALDGLLEKDGKLFGFNDGKWQGAIATCGLVEANWMKKNYDGDMFYPKYFGHYNDTELTILAMNDKSYVYNPDVSLIEVDYEKEQKKVHQQDRELFKTRKETMFDGRVSDKDLVENFA